MKILIRKATKKDIPAALGLVKELALFEKAPQEVTNTEADMERDGFGENPVFKMLIAESENLVIGIAIYFIKYSTWKGRGVYLDDIVVGEAFRGKGVGSKLFDAVIDDCKKLGAKQLHWQVLDWNEPAIKFYEKYEASFDSEWINCKMTEQQILNFKSQS